MARTRSSLLYVGIRAHVVAFDAKTGLEVWRTALPSKYRSSNAFVSVMRDADGLYATCAGELFSLDPRTGALLWHDALKGLGTGFVSLASDAGGSTNDTAATAEATRRRQAAAAGAAS